MCRPHYEEWLAAAPPEAKIRRTAYPPPDEIVAMFERERSIGAVARLIGVSRKTLDDYLARRRDLAERVQQFRKPELLTPEEVRKRGILATLSWKTRNRDTARAINRRWAKNQDPAARRYWNNYNRLRREGRLAQIPTQTPEQAALAREYQQILAGDPCVYCGGPAGTVDHIRPINNAGVDTWENQAPACQSCNSSKNDSDLLFFLLRRLDDVAQHAGGGGSNPVGGSL